MRRPGRKSGLALLFLLLLLSLTGCSRKGFKIALTGGLKENELFAVNKDVMTVPEAKLLLMTELARYRNLYGEEMLEQQFGDQTLEESVKESTLSLMGKIMIMDQMAEKYQVRLSREDTTGIEEAAVSYMASLNDDEKTFCGAEVGDVQNLLGKILLADRLYAQITGEQELEVSDDEARVVTVRHILIKTTVTDEDGSQRAMSEAEKNDARTQIMEIFDQLSQGADFDSMAQQYSEDSQEEYQVAREDVEEELEETLFSLDSGEMSTVLENETGYHIFLCVDNFDRTATEQNRQQLLEERRWKAFEDTYNEFAAGQTCEFAKKRWKSITLNGENITNTGLYSVYRSLL